MTLSPIFYTAGQYQIDQSAVAYLRANRVYINSVNLKPGANVNVHIDDTNVNQFVQPASTITVNVGFAANGLNSEEGIYCNTTHAYAIVLQDSAGGVLSVDESFLCLNLSAYGANSFSSTTYAPGDLVYQTPLNNGNFYANTFLGRVENWVSQDGAIAITPIYGQVYTAATGNNVLFKVGSTVLANVTTPVIGNKFPVGSTITSTENVSSVFTANGWYHASGVITTVAANLNQLQVSGWLNGTVIGQPIYLVNGLGIGQSATITNLTGNNLVTLNTSWVGHSGNSFYAIGQANVDGIGLSTTILRIPEDANVKFQTGSRLITINDKFNSNDNSASMIATATYVASGSLGAVGTPVAPKTPTVSPGSNTTVAPSSPTSTSINNNGPINNPAASADPLVQTFFTPKPINPGQTDYGIFATSVNLFLQAKPVGSSTQFPICVYLVDTDNGFPTTNILATSTVRWEDVMTTDGSNTFPDSSNTQTFTKFTFDNPVYLAPGTEYGIVVYSESPDYQIWVSQLGETIINSTRLVSQSPYLGSFFKSQNASAWNPIQNQQLMFVLNKAQFSTNTTVNLNFNVDPQPQPVLLDSLILHSSDLTLPPTSISYGVKTMVANTAAQDVGFIPVNVNTPYSFGSDLKNSSLYANRRRMIDAGNANAFIVQVQMATSNPDVSPFFHDERLSLIGITNFINNGSLANNNISITSGGNHINAANIIVTIDAPVSTGGIQATANVLANALSGNSVVALNIINPGSGYITTPNVTLTEASAPSNATAVITGETSIGDGNSLAKYITRQITLADGFDSGDIQVFMDAIRPQGTDIEVYYKVLSGQDTDVLSNKNWQRMFKAADVYSPDQQTSVSLNFNTGTNKLGVPRGSVSYVQNGTTYPLGGKFKSFAIKITLLANDTTVPPFVLNYRAIAVPSG